MTAVPDLAESIAALADELRRVPHPRVSYRVEDAAEMVGVSRSEMYRLVQTGKVGRVPNMGVRVIIPHVELERVFGTVDGQLRGVA